MARYFRTVDEEGYETDFKSEDGKIYLLLSYGWQKLPDGFFGDERDLIVCYSEDGCSITDLEEDPHGD